MYTPSHFKQEDLSAIHEAMRRIGYVSLVTNTAHGLVATQAPVLLDAEGSEHGVLRGHIARANLQWKDTPERTEALAIFTGANAYISPSWYATKREHGKVVPTWNYIAIHAYGEIHFSDDRTQLLDIVTRLTEAHESSFQRPWKVSDAPAEYIEGLLRAIVAFEMKITRIESAWKLSQNRSDADRAGAMAGLHDRGEEVAKEMERLYAPPSTKDKNR